MCKKLITLAILVCVMGFGGMARAGLFDPPIENPSFETTDLTSGTAWVDYCENWIISSQGSAYLENGSWYPAADGINTLKMWTPVAVWQQIGTWDQNIDYEISMYVGRSDAASALQVELWVGGNPSLLPLSPNQSYGFGAIDTSVGATLIVGETLTPTGAVGGNELMTLILNTGTGFTPGQALWLRIQSISGSYTYLDNVMVASLIDPFLASQPKPANEGTEVLRDVILSWTPGIFAQKHDVYFGTNPDNVGNASRTDPQDVLIIQGQDANNYDIGRLEFGQTYFWRIDEVNAPPDSTIFNGEIWSFTVEPEAYPIPAGSITATASSQGSANESPEKTIDGSGLNADDLHSVDTKTMWLSAGGDPGSAWIHYEFDKLYKLHEMFIWNYNGSGILYLYGIQNATIEYSIDGADWTQVGVSEFAPAPGEDGYAANTTIDFDGAAAKYVRITANNNFGGGASVFNRYGLSEVRFTSIPVNAKEPSPGIGATEVAVNTTLSWRAGREAAEHQVYLSTDQQAVADGSALIATVSQARYSPTLALGSTYYWRVDEVNNAEATTNWPSDIWSFSTQDYLVVDDFESYNDITTGQEGSHLVYETWTDGYLNPATNGSTIGYVSGMSMETDIVHGGIQSVPIIYDNSTASSSEVTVNTNNLPIGRNWSIGSPQTLVLWIHGNVDNLATNKLYVKINNTKVPYGSNLSIPLWKQWNIDLTSLGINLSNVTSFAIGVEGSGSGMFYLDDIALYRAAPPIVEPIDPGTGNLVVRYEMTNNVQDSSGSGLNGTAYGSPAYGQSLTGYGTALVFDGSDDYVELPIGSTISTLTNCTIATWVNWSEEGTAYQRIFDFGTGTATNMFLTPSTGSAMRFAITTSGSGGEFRATASPVLPTGWHNVAVVIDGTSMSLGLYLDGEIMISRPTQIVPSDLGNTTQNWLGRSQYTGDSYFNGSLDDFRIYNTALSEGQVRYIAGDR
jgi:hypothetical protein